MTVSSSLNRKAYTGDGVTTSFSTSPVVFYDTDELDVYVVTTATGASTTLTENTHYTVSGGAGATGAVSLAGGSSPYGAPSASQTLVIVRTLDVVQEFDPQNNDGSDAGNIETAFDKLTMMTQQNAAAIARSFRLDDSDVSGVSLTVPTPTAGEILRWNLAGTALEGISADPDDGTFTQSGSGAVARTFSAKLGDTVSVRDFGPVANGTSDDQAALQAAVTYATSVGKCVSLDGATIGIGSQITWDGDGGGIVGPGHIVMLTGSGQFQETTVANKYQTDACGIYVQGYDDVMFSGFKISLGGSPSADSICMAIAIRDSHRSRISACELTGFKKSDGVVCVDSSFDCDVVLNAIHTCAANGATAGQLTGINVDDSRISSVGSERLNLSYNSIYDLTCDATFIAANGYQSDGINISEQSSSTHTIVGNAIDTVGEGIDCFGMNCVIAGNTIVDAYLTGVKLVHGAQHNNIYGNRILRSGKHGIALFGSDVATSNVQYNHIHGNLISGTGDAGNFNATNVGILTDEDAATTRKITNNLIHDNTVIAGTNAAHGIYAAASASVSDDWVDNRTYGSFSVAAVVNNNNAAIRMANKSYVLAVRATSAQTIATATLTTVLFNSETTDVNSEYDPTTGIFTANAPRRVSVTAQVRTPSATADDKWELVIDKNNGTQWFNTQFVAKTDEFTIQTSGQISLNVGNTLRIKVRHNRGADQDLTANSALTYLQIIEV